MVHVDNSRELTAASTNWSVLTASSFPSRVRISTEAFYARLGFTCGIGTTAIGCRTAGAPSFT